MNFALLSAEPSVLMVIGLGIGTVFVGLIALILVCSLLGIVVRAFEKPTAKAEETPVAVDASNDLYATDRGTFMAAVSAAIAEESGTDASGIRIVSVKRL